MATAPKLVVHVEIPRMVTRGQGIALALCSFLNSVGIIALACAVGGRS